MHLWQGLFSSLFIFLFKTQEALELAVQLLQYKHLIHWNESLEAHTYSTHEKLQGSRKKKDVHGLFNKPSVIGAAWGKKKRRAICDHKRGANQWRGIVSRAPQRSCGKQTSFSASFGDAGQAQMQRGLKARSTGPGASACLRRPQQRCTMTQRKSTETFHFPSQLRETPEPRQKMTTGANETCLARVQRKCKKQKPCINVTEI